MNVLGVLCGLLTGLIAASSGHAAHGVSLDGTLKYAKGFQRFAYTSPEAVSGGELILHSQGSFDKLNPFTLKGVAARGMEHYVFETLAVSSLDEPFAMYGLLAKDIELTQDHRAVVFTLDERACFSDGSPVTAEDVRYSLETLKGKDAHPFYQIYFKDIASADILDTRKIRFNFSRVNRELHMIAAQLPIVSRAYFQQYGFNQATSFAHPPVGSGPYVVDQVINGKTIKYKKNTKYWAIDHPTRRKQFNFTGITIKYFKDPVVSLEAFKSGEFDLLNVTIAKQWQRDLTGRRFANGELLKKAFPHRNTAGMQGFVFNTRNQLFADRDVRKALGLAFDFEWTNASLFYGQYKRTTSFFANSAMAATGLPKGKELALLERFRSSLPKEVFTTPLTPPVTTAPSSLRTNLRQASRLLKARGWQVRDGKLTHQDGRIFKFSILLANSSFERVMAAYAANLRKLGIEVDYRTVDAALYTDRVRSFDFDMVVGVFGQSQSPGNEQRDFWGSDAATHKGSRNLAGINDPVVDALVEEVVYATTREELVTACRALDRVLWYGYYVVPNWYLDAYRFGFRAGLRYPQTLPLYYGPMQFIDTWWQGQ
ncbi:MAG: ABC transporter substrate-binding protein [Desulfobulbus propionicus]|nr:MAG: ABC transporter substrate-binding protein [Desulfobulbus propionicus]